MPLDRRWRWERLARRGLRARDRAPSSPVAFCLRTREERLARRGLEASAAAPSAPMSLLTRLREERLARWGLAARARAPSPDGVVAQVEVAEVGQAGA